MRGVTVTDVLKISPNAKVSEPALLDRPKNPWSNAQPTEVGGIKFPSKVQARVYAALVSEYGSDCIRCDVRMPLVSGIKEGAKCLYITIDFAIVINGRVVKWIDAKTRRKSRDWVRGKAMFEASWGKIVEWDGVGEVPVG